ncbi:MAG: glycosyltransferase family 87 protein [Pirellulaceae bacterium]
MQHTASQTMTQAWDEAAARFRFAGVATLIIAVAGYAAWLSPFDDLLDRSGTPLGGDYVMLYVAGQAISSGQTATLYDDYQNQLRSRKLIPQMDPDESWPYRYPPTVAVCMVPLSWLPFATSYAVFLAIQICLLAGAVYFMRQQSQALRNRPAWVFAIVGCPLVLETLMGGQSSLLALAIVTAYFHFFRRQQHAVAGAILALGLYKPNVLWLVILASLMVRPKLLRGFAPMAGLGLAVAWWATGLEGILSYVELATQLASNSWGLETPYWKVHGLASYFEWLVPKRGRMLCTLAGVILSICVAGGWRWKGISDHAALALLLAFGGLLNPYVPIYDLVLLIAALVYAVEAYQVAGAPHPSPIGFQSLAAILFLGPHLSQTLCSASRIQLFPLLLALICVAGLVAVLRQTFRNRRRCVGLCDRVGSLFSLNRLTHWQPHVAISGISSVAALLKRLPTLSCGLQVRERLRLFFPIATTRIRPRKGLAKSRKHTKVEANRGLPLHGQGSMTCDFVEPAKSKW